MRTEREEAGNNNSIMVTVRAMLEWIVRSESAGRDVQPHTELPQALCPGLALIGYKRAGDTQE